MFITGMYMYVAWINIASVLETEKCYCVVVYTLSFAFVFLLALIYTGEARYL